MAATTTLADVQAELALWKAARLAVMKGRSFSKDGRSLTRSDIKDIDLMVNRLKREERNFLEAADTPSGEDPSPINYSLRVFK